MTIFHFTASIAPIALPAGSEINEDFSGEPAIVSGFGRTSDCKYQLNSNLLL